MRMAGPAMDIKFLEDLPAELVLGDHPPDGAADDSFGLIREEAFQGLALLPDGGFNGRAQGKSARKKGGVLPPGSAGDRAPGP